MTDRPIPDPLKVGREILAAEHSTAVQNGIYLGGLLILVMITALFVANRVPGTERYALERNAGFYALFVLFMLIPVVRYLYRPMSMFVSAMIGWSLFIVAYDIAGMFYQNLFQSPRRPPFVAFIEGAVVYGVAAVGSWVGDMALRARHNPIAPRRRRTDHLHHQP